MTTLKRPLYYRPRRVRALSFLDIIFSLEIKPFEFWTALFAVLLGVTFMSDGTLMAAPGQEKLIGIHIDFIGAALITGGLTQGLGLLCYLGNLVAMSRVLRWAGSCIEGAAWAVCAVYVVATPSTPDELVWVYALLFIQEAWVVMSLAYRGFTDGRAH